MTTRDDHSRGRLVRLCALGVLGALATILVATTGGARAAFFEKPTIAVTATPSTVQVGDPVTLEATVSATSGYPDGAVTFSTLDAAGQPGPPLAPAVAVTPLGPATAHATLTTSFQPGTYQVVASYLPADPTAFVGANTNTSPALLVVGASPPHETRTVVAADPALVVPGEPETLTATVTVDDASGLVPTGRVKFLDNGADIGSAYLVNGVATLQRVQGFGPGTHELTASYLGNAFDRTSDADPLFNPSSQTIRLTTSTGLGGTTTHTTVTISRSPINQGDRVTLVAHVVQDGGALLPAGDNVVKFTVDGTSLTIGSAQVDANGDAVLTDVGSWPIGTFTIVASYIGNSFVVPNMNPSNGKVELEVWPAAAATTLTLDGLPAEVYGGHVAFTAHLSDTHGPISYKEVTIAFGSQSCTDYTEDDGTLRCEFDVTDPSMSSVSASFAGDLDDAPASASSPFAVVPAPTGLTVSLVGQGTLVGTLLDGDGAPIAGRSVHLTLGDHACDGVTSPAGIATCHAAPLAGQIEADVTATFAGDTAYAPAFAAATVVLGTTVETTLAWTGAPTAAFGEATTLSAVLRDADGAPLAGYPVTLAMGAQSCEAPTDDAGVAACDVVVDQAAGTYPASAAFAGSDPYLPSDAAGSFQVTRALDTLTLDAPAAALAGSTVTLHGTLLDAHGAPIAGRTVTLTLGTATCTVATAADGTAQCDLGAAGSGPVAAGATFDGDVYYVPATASATVLVQVPTTLELTGSTTADHHDATILAARLTGAPSGAPVTFTVGTQICPATTDSTGIATCSFTPQQAAGDYPLTVSYAGDGIHLPSSAQGTFTVTREQATLTVAAPATAASGAPVELTATLLEDGVSPVAGRSVTLTLGSAGCSATTGDDGAASCEVTAPTPTGPAAVSGDFAGDDRYVPGHDSASTLVYGLAPGGGTFVIGDRSGAGTVTFWGSQWWKLNEISSGTAPSSFKGYALHPAAPSCGTTWTTAPGNSSPPPRGPLPAYMAVVVTTHAAKIGATIFGDTAHVVVVRTGAGYDANPGHAGTGTVVATVC